MAKDEDPEKRDALDYVLGKMPWLTRGWFLGGLLPIMPVIAFSAAAIFGINAPIGFVIITIASIPVILLLIFAIILLLDSLLENPIATLAIAIFLGLVILSATLSKGGSYHGPDAECSYTLSMSGRIAC